MPNLIYITDDWSAQPWYSTGGTRAKKYLQAPNGKFYYFKRSQFKPASEIKPGKDFKYEFWSEIIAFEIGTLLGFNVLQYDIAVDTDIMGCISESMINPDKEELIEGIKYLQAYDDKFNPELKEYRPKYTFQLIEAALSNIKIEKFKEKIVEIIVFDSIIGNSDRHQENWAIINQFTESTKTYKKLEDYVSKKNGLKASLKDWLSQTVQRIKLHSSRVVDFAPIYDNGSSLGRELTEGKIIQLINNDAELDSYVNRGLSEIHWNGAKITHFELMRNLLNSSYRPILESIVARVFKKFDGPGIEHIIQRVDSEVPEKFSTYKIPDYRKHLIHQIITLRLQKLRQLINEGI